MAHRGPDDQGFYFGDQVTLGHRRLNIIDLNSGKQPIHNEEGNIWVVYNGEIYNYQNLTTELKKIGHTFYTKSDTEVIVHAYEQWGMQCLDHFNGMFAFALYDDNSKNLFLARDRFGVKPLYYLFDKGSLIFASEIKAILEYTEIKPEVDLRALHQYFRFRYVPGELTLFCRIKKLLAGTFMVFKDGSITFGQYYDLHESITADPEEVCISRLQQVLRDAVHSRLVSEVPLGVYLSGGIDSAAIVALMSEKTDNIKTFTMDFPTAPDSERSYAQKVADQFSTDHHEFFFNESDLADIPKMVWHLDEPIGDAATLPTMVLSREAKKFVTVVLAGEGGDETFAGYDNQRIMTRCMMFDHLPKPLKRVVSSLNKFTPIESNVHRLLDVFSSSGLPAQYTSLVSLFSDEECKKVGLRSMEDKVNPGIKQESVIKTTVTDTSTLDTFLPPSADLNLNISRFFPCTMKPLNQMLYFGFKTWLPNDFCMKADKMTMAYGIEERTPFLDYKLVDFAFTLPTQYKIRQGVGKYLLKKSLQPFLPKEIIYRKKHGYNAPMDRWFKGPLKSTLENLLEERSHNLYDKEYAKYLLDKFQRSGENYSLNFFNAQKLWSILVFELWYRIFIERIDYGKICL